MGIGELLVGGVIGAVLGYALPKVYELLLHQYGQRKIQEFRKRSAKSALYDWIVSFHDVTSSNAAPYSIETLYGPAKIPFVTMNEWLANFQVGASGDPLIIVEENNDKPFKVDRRGIRRRERMGQRLFDAPALYFRSIQVTNGRLQVRARPCSYFEVASSLLKLENETFRRVSRVGRFARSKFREDYFGVENGVFRGRPFSIAASVGVVLQFENSREILLHSRSHETVTYGGMRAVIPYFGMVPMGQTSTARARQEWRSNSNDTLVEANIVKEYCEELFSYDDLILETDLRTLTPSWLWTKPQACELRELLDSGRAELRCLGFGFDGLNGSATLSFLLMINDPLASRALEKNISGNWEVASLSGARGSIELVPLRHDALAPLLESRIFSYGSAFTVSRALSLYGY